MTESSTSAPMDIGAVLRQARMSQGQSLEVVHQHTRIPKKFLEAMENNHFDDFPATVYLRGFLKSYCEHLDIDFEPLWNQIVPRKSPADASDGNGSTAAAPESHTEKQTTSFSEDRQREADTGFQLRALQTALLPIFLLVILFAGGAILWMIQKGKPAPAPLPPPPAPPAAIAPIRSKEKMTLRINFHSDSWVRLHCDGILRFEGRAPAGFVQEWSAMSDFILRTTTPNDISLSIDGHEIKLTPSMKGPSGDYKITHP